jgi:glutamyl-tRNA synthetase
MVASRFYLPSSPPSHPATSLPTMDSSSRPYPPELQDLFEPPPKLNWRFRVPDDQPITFVDQKCGPQTFVSGHDFGDFIVWRGVDGIPSYELAVVIDDIKMGITEVVRGEDLLLSTARQILLYHALSDSKIRIPSFYHCPLVRDEEGKRLAKRAPSRTLRSLREMNYTPERIIEEFFDEDIKALLNR